MAGNTHNGELLVLFSPPWPNEIISTMSQSALTSTGVIHSKRFHFRIHTHSGVHAQVVSPLVPSSPGCVSLLSDQQFIASEGADCWLRHCLFPSIRVAAPGPRAPLK